MNRYFGNLRRFLNREYIPVTKGIVVASTGLFIAHHLLALFRIDLYSYFQFATLRWLVRPWTILTYPLVNGDLRNLLGLFFSFLWLWYIGGSLERSWGGQTYGLFLGLATALTGLAFSIVSFFLRLNISIAGLWLPLTGLTWAWAKLYPDRELLFWGLFPIKAQWLSWLQAGMVFYQYLQYNLGYALAAVSSIAVVYLFSGRGPFARGFRYWAWTHNLSGGGWREKLRNKWRRRRMKVAK